MFSRVYRKDKATSMASRQPGKRSRAPADSVHDSVDCGR